LDASKALVGAALVLAIAAIAGVYVAQPVSNIDYCTPPAGTVVEGDGAQAPGEGDTITSPPPAGEEDDTPVTVTVRGVSISVYEAGEGSTMLPYVTAIHVNYIVGGGNHTVVVELELPTPCHSANLSYDGSLLRIDITSPPSGVMCVQTLKPVTLSVEWQGPPPEELLVEVYRDGELVGSARLPVNPPY